MRTFQYLSGNEVQQGDHVRYHGENGKVVFVVSEKTGDSTLDWYVDEYQGGLMISAEGFGSVFLGVEDIDESLEFVERVAP